MRQIKFILIASLISLFKLNTHSQNIIYNSSFEDGDYAGALDPYTSIPLAPIDYLYNWIRNAEDYGSPAHTTWGDHEPEWRFVSAINTSVQPFGLPYNKDSDYVSNTVTYFNPATGDGMIGMGSAELVQQGFNLTAVKEYLANANNPQFKLRFKIRIPNTTNAAISSSSKLSFYISKNKLRYKNEPRCTEKFQKIDNLLSHYFSIFDETNLQSSYPPGSWHTIERIITLPNDMDGYEWLGINLTSFDGPGESLFDYSPECWGKEYLYLDDIELVFDCGTCSKVSGVVYPQLYGNLIANSDQNIVRITNLNNIDNLTFKVFASNSDLVYSDYAYCPNGINHDIFWTGKNAGGSDLANATYNYELTAGNGCYSKTFKGKITKIANYSGTIISNFSQVCETGSNLSPLECCNLDYCKNNEVLIGPTVTDYIIQRNIWVCTKTPDFSDEVRVKDNANILFQAGKQITLREGFNTDPGAIFVAQIDPSYCGDTDETSGGNKRSGINSGNNDNNLDETIYDLAAIDIYPNPSNGLYSITGVDKGNVVVYDVLGSLVCNQQIEKDRTVVDLTHHKNGLYFFEITTKNSKKTYKIIKQ